MGIIYSHARRDSAQVLQQKILSLLTKGAIQIVPPEQSQCGFYSKYFPMLKKWGTGLCPVLDLWDLNRYLRFLRFRRLTHTALLRTVCPGNWLTSVNLFSHTNTVYALHRKYLRCAFPGTTYVCMVLSLEISLSPQVFVKCTEAAIAPSRKQGIRVATYINWLVRSGPLEHKNMLLLHMESLVLRVNQEKSILTPNKSISFIGLTLDMVFLKAYLSAKQVKAFLACLALFCRENLLVFRTCLQLLGLMASAIVVIPAVYTWEAFSVALSPWDWTAHIIGIVRWGFWWIVWQHFISGSSPFFFHTEDFNGTSHVSS